MNPASRNSNSHVTNIGITSPLGKAKRICVPVREATATVYGALRVLKVPYIFSPKDNKSQYIPAIYTRFSEVFRFGDFCFLRVLGDKNYAT